MKGTLGFFELRYFFSQYPLNRIQPNPSCGQDVSADSCLLRDTPLDICGGGGGVFVDFLPFSYAVNFKLCYVSLTNENIRFSRMASIKVPYFVCYIFNKLVFVFLWKKWNESGFRPPLCTYRLNWARRTSWGWWDDGDDAVLQTQDSKFEPWRSEAEHATSRSRRFPTILTFTRGWGRNIFCFFHTAETGNRTPNSSVKGSGANHYPRAPALLWKKHLHILLFKHTFPSQ